MPFDSSSPRALRARADSSLRANGVSSGERPFFPASISLPFALSEESRVVRAKRARLATTSRRAVAPRLHALRLVIASRASRASRFLAQGERGFLRRTAFLPSLDLPPVRPERGVASRASEASATRDDESKGRRAKAPCPSTRHRLARFAREPIPRSGRTGFPQANGLSSQPRSPSRSP